MDPGGANWAGAGPNAAQQLQHSSRVRRIFAVVINQIQPGWFYDYVSSTFHNEGIEAAEYIRDTQELVLDQDELEEMEADWSAMNVENTKINIDQNTMYKWHAKVENEGDLFVPAKTPAQKYMKFLQGLPNGIIDQVMNEQAMPNPAYNHPANYPAGHPLAGQPHPQAGQKNMVAVRDAFQAFWKLKIKRGAIRERIFDANEAETEATEAANLVNPDFRQGTYRNAFGGKGRGKGKGRGRGGYRGRGGGRGNNNRPPPFPKMELTKEIDERAICYRCGGVGHIARVQCKDGKWLFCASQAQFEREKLSQITYPHIPNPWAEANEVQAEDENEGNDEEEQEEDAGFAGLDEETERMQLAGMAFDGEDNENDA